MSWGSSPHYAIASTMSSGSVSMNPTVSGTSGTPTLLIVSVANAGSTGAASVTESGQTWTQLADEICTGLARITVFGRTCTTAATLTLTVAASGAGATGYVGFEEWIGITGSSIPVLDGTVSAAMDTSAVSNTASATTGTLAYTPNTSTTLVLSSCVTGAGTAPTFTASGGITKDTSASTGKSAIGYDVNPTSGTQITPQWAFSATRTYAAVVFGVLLNTTQTDSGILMAI